MKKRAGQVILATVMLWPIALPIEVPTGGHAQCDLPAADPRERAAHLVAELRRADYEGDRAALQRLHQALAPPANDSRLASRVRYWRGFALWRRAINGFNEPAGRSELESDLQHATREFEAALSRDPLFADASVGLAACLSLIGYLHRSDPVRLNELRAQVMRLTGDLEKSAPDNPRLLWVLGPNSWYTPPDTSPEQVDERQTKVVAMYERGLHLVREQKGKILDVLEPSWGEPELLMSLAWSSLNRRVPDVAAAERYAAQALALVPHWHYVRDILMPQIRDAKKE